MKLTLKEIKKFVEKEVIVEIRLKRWLGRHFQDTGFASITSDRGDEDPEVNDANFQELMKLFRGAGYGFVKTEGGWEETQDSGKTHVTERSLMIPGQSKKMDGEDSIKALFELCKTTCDMYNQEAFLFGWGKYYETRPEGPEEPFAAVYGPDGSVLYGPFSATEEGSALQVWSRLVKGRDRRMKFAFTEWKAASPPSNQFEAMGRASQGEIFLAKPEV